jgi:hypothetical protein
MNQEQSEILALQALTFLASDEKRLSWLMTETGLDPTGLSNPTDRLEILAGVLDFLLNHEDILIDFCAAENINASNPARARRFLPGALMEDY